jgi:hypothetical protein
MVCVNMIMFRGRGPAREMDYCASDKPCSYSIGTMLKLDQMPHVKLLGRLPAYELSLPPYVDRQQNDLLPDERIAILKLMNSHCMRSQHCGEPGVIMNIQLTLPHQCRLVCVQK